MWLLSGCSEPEAEAVLAYVRADDGTYQVEPRVVPELVDPFTMQGDLGDVGAGGRIADNAAGTAWSGGRALWVAADVQEGVAIPPDEDGLLLFSFYAHLAGAATRAAAHGVDTALLFPVDMAFSPAVSPLIELQPMDNAAYLPGNHLFVLLPDGHDRDVPMLANEGVILHEFGHAILHLILAGDPWVASPGGDTTTREGQWVASVHEGFADLFAALVLDDPRFLDPTISMPSRWLDADASTATVVMPQEEAALLYDPYPLGSVFASIGWDIRLTGDADATLDGVLGATTAWAAGGSLDGWSWLSAWRDTLGDDVVCAAVAVRAPGHEAEVGCP